MSDLDMLTEADEQEAATVAASLRDGETAVQALSGGT
jgi:hypothetical protein